MDTLRSWFARFDVPIKLTLFMGLIVVGVFTYFNSGKPKEKSNRVISQDVPPDTIIETQVVESCGIICEQKIFETVNRAIATLSAKLNTETKTATPVPTAKPTATAKVTKVKQTSYVPIGGTQTTTKTDWTDLTNTDFYFDISEYGTVLEAKWSANLKLQHGNGEAYARLFDVTNGVAIPGSEISTKNPSFTLVESGALSFLSGKNRYRVQMKSLSSFEVSFDAARIKIIWE